MTSIKTAPPAGNASAAPVEPRNPKDESEKGILDSIGEAVSAPLRDAAEEDDREKMLDKVPPKKQPRV